jgi:hypothetical protein
MNSKNIIFQDVNRFHHIRESCCPHLLGRYNNLRNNYARAFRYFRATDVLRFLDSAAMK